MAQPFVGQIIPVGFSFAPVGWLLCNGQTVPIAPYQVLYTLIGTTYGGDGVTTFGLPNLNGTAPLGMGQGQGLSPYVIGQIGGAEGVSLTSNQVGTHNHAAQASAKTGTTATPASTLALGQNAQTLVSMYGAPPTTTSLSPASIGANGNSVPHENRQPYLAVNYIIAYAGLFPSQS
jgi:microcystin-dependent protein